MEAEAWLARTKMLRWGSTVSVHLRPQAPQELWAPWTPWECGTQQAHQTHDDDYLCSDGTIASWQRTDQCSKGGSEL